MYAAYMGIMASMCASPAELAESSSPYRHLARDTQRVKAAGEWVHDLLGQAQKAILGFDKTVTGFNVGVNVGKAAGQSILHVHVHLMPRRKGDTDNPKGGVRGAIPHKRTY